MGSYEIDELTQRLHAVRDKAAHMLATDGGARQRSRWPGWMLWFGIGIGIGAAAAGGRLTRILPEQLVARFDELVGRLTSAAAEPAGLVDSLEGDMGAPGGEAIREPAETIDLTEQTGDPVTETPGLG